MSKTDDTKALSQIVAALRTGEATRLDFGRGERLHIDRPMPLVSGRTQRAKPNDCTSCSIRRLVP